ncbi:Phosphoserine phosphatase [Corynebacterium kalinowskii]|uniref:phosphoserine phosphatase n=1 Tax=Corynebacterium kalinowskii TaxID=2675216 RepID=A0A6B8VQU1_9CORY|nr:phosphoserine phosphatase SerB [Corynebacterium kalinowskii]QGU01385.1 Phosphoserine phosphatase [Corynebacterium kalinowskii]
MTTEPFNALTAGLTPVLIKVTGQDKSGVSAAVFRVLAAHGVQLVDIEQSVFRGHLSLAAFVGINPDRIDTVTEGLKNTLQILGLQVRVEELKEVPEPRPHSTHVLALLGSAITAEHVHRVGQTLANYGANIEAYRGLTDYPITAIELDVSVANPNPGGGVPLRRALAELSHEIGIDIAIDRAGVERRAKRLICFDCDSTLITQEVIEMLAAYAGREEEVAAVTERAMRGELDFEQSLRERVATLAGLDESVIHAVAKDLQLTPGVRTTLKALQKMGFKTAVVSGGFIQVLEGLAEELELDYVRANTLEIVDGKLTGRVIGKVVDRRAKAEFLGEFAADSGLEMRHTVAVGDGANDIDMISAAGLGIAFNAKPALRDVADTSVNSPFMDEVLYMLGLNKIDVERALR